MRKAFWIILSSFCVLIQAGGESSVWKVSRGEDFLYLGGTIHVLSREDYPLPREFEEVYGLSDILVFETDISGSAGPETQAALLQGLSYQDGRSLDQVITLKTRKKLDLYLKQFGLDFNSMKIFKPGMISTVITMLELERLGISSEGVDVYFSGKAAADGKETGQLETMEEQIGFLARMGEGKEDELILSSLSDVENMPVMMAELIRAWRSGDTEALETSLIMELQRDFPQVYEDLLAARNRAWLPRIEEMAGTAAVEFVLVGDAHMVGKDGLLNLLSEKGFTVEKY